MSGVIAKLAEKQLTSHSGRADVAERRLGLRRAFQCGGLVMVGSSANTAVQNCGHSQLGPFWLLLHSSGAGGLL